MEGRYFMVVLLLAPLLLPCSIYHGLKPMAIVIKPLSGVFGLFRGCELKRPTRRVELQ